MLLRPASPPARLDAAQTAAALGFREHDIPILVSTKLLKPLGKPVQSASKFFAACEIETLSQDVSWLNKATQSVYEYWRGKNARKSINASTNPPDEKMVSMSA